MLIFDKIEYLKKEIANIKTRVRYVYIIYIHIIFICSLYILCNILFDWSMQVGHLDGNWFELLMIGNWRKKVFSGCIVGLIRRVREWCGQR